MNRTLIVLIVASFIPVGSAQAQSRGSRSRDGRATVGRAVPREDPYRGDARRDDGYRGDRRGERPWSTSPPEYYTGGRDQVTELLNETKSRTCFSGLYDPWQDRCLSRHAYQGRFYYGDYDRGRNVFVAYYDSNYRRYDRPVELAAIIAETGAHIFDSYLGHRERMKAMEPPQQAPQYGMQPQGGVPQGYYREEPSTPIRRGGDPRMSGDEVTLTVTNITSFSGWICDGQVSSLRDECIVFKAGQKKTLVVPTNKKWYFYLAVTQDDGSVEAVEAVRETTATGWLIKLADQQKKR